MITSRGKIRCNRSSTFRKRTINLLRIPITLISLCNRRVRARLIHDTPAKPGKYFIRLCIQGRNYSLVVPVKEDEFSVLGHSGIHRTGVVSDYGTSETSGLCLHTC